MREPNGPTASRISAFQVRLLRRTIRHALLFQLESSSRFDELANLLPSQTPQTDFSWLIKAPVLLRREISISTIDPKLLTPMAGLARSIPRASKTTAKRFLFRELLTE